MKKGILCLLVSVFAVLFTGNVEARDLNIATSSALGDKVKFEQSYDSKNDVNKINIKVSLNDALIDTVLNQKPGVGASKGSFYVKFDPTELAGKSYYKENYYFAKDASIASMKAKVQELVDVSEAGNCAQKYDGNVCYTTGTATWPFGVALQYKDGGNWKNLSGATDGTSSNLDYLLAALNLTDRSQLVYNENYRIFMYEDFVWLYEFEDKDNTDSKEFVLVSYEIAFPVTAKMDNGTAVYYANLETALQSESKNIVVTENITVNNATIAKDIKVTVNEGVTLSVDGKLDNKGTVVNAGTISIAESATLLNSGSLKNSGKIVNNGVEEYTVSAKTNTSLVEDGNIYAEGDTVSFTVTTKKGFTAKPVVKFGTKTVKVTKAEDGSYTFTMPKGNVTISVNYVEPSAKNPNTADPIKAYGLLGLFSMFGLAVLSFLKKRA